MPITTDKQLPGERLEPFHGLVLSENPKDYQDQLPRSLFENRVKEAQENFHALFECAKRQEDRTRWLVEYASRIRNLEFYGKVRQKAHFSSFAIPDLPLTHKEWKIRSEPYVISPHLCELLWKERRIMEAHAKKTGCRLIIDPYIELNLTVQGRLARLATLKSFLEMMPSDKVEVAFPREGIHQEGNLVILGDWFAARQ